MNFAAASGFIRAHFPCVRHDTISRYIAEEMNSKGRVSNYCIELMISQGCNYSGEHTEGFDPPSTED